MFLNHPWEEYLLPWGHITELGKKSSKVVAAFNVTHCILLWGPHYRNHRTAIPWHAFNYLYFYFTLWFSCSFYFCDITFSFLHWKWETEEETDPTGQRCWETFFILISEFAIYFSIQFLMTKQSALPPSQTFGFCLWTVCLCTFQHMQF